MVKCPNCDSEVPSDAVYCPMCGSSITPSAPQVPTPVELPATIRGTDTLGKGGEFLGKNLILCVPKLVGLLIVLVMGFIAGLMMASVIISSIGQIGSQEEAIKLGIRVGVSFGLILAIIVVPINIFIDGWLAASSLEAIQTGRAKLTGRPTKLVGKRAGQLLLASILNILIAAPTTAWLLSWMSTASTEAVMNSAQLYASLLGFVDTVVNTFLLFFIVLIVAANRSAVSSLVSSVTMMARILRDDSAFFFSILGINLLIWLIGLVPIVGGLIVLLLYLFIAPLIMLSALVYLKVNFKI